MTKLRFALFCTFAAQLNGADIGLFQNSGSATANLVLNPGPSQQVVTAVATGFYDNFGNGTGTYAGPQFDPSYFTGSVAGTEFRSYFIFDLSSLSPALKLNAARLDLQNPLNSAFGVPFTLNVNPLGFANYDVSDLASGNGGIAAFTDLGDGTPYGSAFVTNAAATSVAVSLNAAGLSLLTAGLGNGFAPFGGSLLAPAASAVPEPATWTLTVASLAVVLMGARRLHGASKGAGL